jgi:phospholipase C
MGTTVYLINQAGVALDVNTTVNPTLSGDDWSVRSAQAPEEKKTALVQFNRDEGITDGRTWTFTTTFTLEDVTVTLQEQVTGTALASNMQQCITTAIGPAPLASTNFQSASSGSLSVHGASGAMYQVSWSLSGGLGFNDISYSVACLAPASARIEPVMKQIETVIVLMLENRSLDTVLGWLYAGTRPAFVYPPGSAPVFDGIVAGAGNSCNGKTYAPADGTQGFPEACRVPAFDPYEPIEHVKRQLYASGTGNMPSGGYYWAQTPPMSGFAWDYYASYEKEPSEVMGAYAARELPILYGIAQAFAVSDRWFSSVPTQTDPNRAFSVCGTSNGAEENSDIDGHTFVGTPTIFNLLAAGGKSWGLFWQAENPAGTGEPITSWKPYTSYYFPALNQAPNGGVLPFSQLLTMLEQGTLPNFCFVEPSWGGGKGTGDGGGWVGIQGNDYHPPAWVGPAEADLNTLYEAIIRSPQWERTLFVITFDEHGGNWDHVAPPAALPPDDRVSKSGFRFDRMGVRVPTILVSPYVRAGTVFRAPAGSTYDLDHTALIATLLKWAGIDPVSAGMGRRVAAAPTFEGVLTGSARTDKPHFEVPAGYAMQGGGTGHLNFSLTGGGPMDIRDFRAATDNSQSGAELVARLQALRATSGS